MHRLVSLLAGASVALLSLPAVGLADHPVAGQKKGPFDENAVPKSVKKALGGQVYAVPGGGYRVDAKRGPDLYTHGPDPVTPALSGGRAPAGDPFGHEEQAKRFGTGSELAPSCVPPSQASSQYYQHVLYAHNPGDPNNVNTYRADIQKEIAQMNFVLNRDSNASSGNAIDASYKVLCDGTGTTTSDIQVDSFSNPYPNDFNGISSAAREAGFDKQNVDYTIFYEDDPDGGNYCGVGGFFSSETPSASNPNNLGNAHGITFVDCWDGNTAMHENGHNQGAVQLNAPHSTGTGAHCFDDFDVMCYNDGGSFDPGPPLATDHCAAPVGPDIYDCGFNSYFSTAANPAGTYLDSNWNIGSSVNRFIDFSGAAPPTNEPPQAAFTHSCNDLDCDFTDQSTDSDGTIASRSWSFGDSGSSSQQNPSHSYSSPGNYDVQLTVTDNEGGQDTVTVPIQASDAGGNVAVLSNGVTEFRSAGPLGSFDRYAFFVPRKRSKLVVTITGEPCDFIPAEDVCRPDLDLYVQRGFHPELDFFQCRPFLYGINERCVFRNPRRGAYGIGVHNYAAEPGTNYTIRAKHRR